MNQTVRSCMRLAVSSSLFFSFSAQAQSPIADEPSAVADAVMTQPQEAMPIQQVQQVSSLEDEMIGGIDWQNNIVFGVGDGIPPTNAVSPAQARVRAKRAAMDEAMARLLESIRAVRVDAESTTRDFINESRAVNTSVSGMVRNAEVEEIRQFDDGSYQVKMRMPIHDQKGLSSTVLPTALNHVRQARMVTHRTRSDSGPTEQPAEGSAMLSQPVVPQPYTAIVIDATGIGASPAMFPRILSSSGEVLYDLSVVDPNVAVLHGMCVYRKSLDKAQQDKRAGGNPLVVKAKDAGGTGRSDLILDDADAAKISALGDGSGILSGAKVLVVID